MASVQRTCPQCGNVMDCLAGQQASAQELYWHETRCCSACGYTLQVDGDSASMDREIRQAILDQDGRWTLHISGTKEQIHELMSLLHRRIACSMNEEHVLLRHRQGPFITGTHAEVIWMAAMLNGAGGRVEICPSTSEAPAELCLDDDGTYRIAIKHQNLLTRENQPEWAALTGQDGYQDFAREVLVHPVYGEIPLVREYFAQGDSRLPREFRWKPDPAFKPELPPGAIEGDVSQQDFCDLCHVPKYFYIDQHKVCVGCGRPFVFSAREQKYWYETLKFNFHSTAIRCLECRRERRKDRSLRRRWAEPLRAAIHAAEEKPDDPLALLELTKATVHYFQALREGDLDRAIAAARKAFRLRPTLYEALYREAACQEAAGRREKARILYERIIDEVQQAELVNRATACAARLRDSLTGC